eukprot:gene6419-biopygen13667
MNSCHEEGVRERNQTEIEAARDRQLDSGREHPRDMSETSSRIPNTFTILKFPVSFGGGRVHACTPFLLDLCFQSVMESANFRKS